VRNDVRVRHRVRLLNDRGRRLSPRFRHRHGCGPDRNLGRLGCRDRNSPLDVSGRSSRANCRDTKHADSSDGHNYGGDGARAENDSFSPLARHGSRRMTAMQAHRRPGTTLVHADWRAF
jgi:hypothetical protein